MFRLEFGPGECYSLVLCIAVVNDRFYILVIKHDITLKLYQDIYIYISGYIYICNIYSTLTGLIYKNIDPRFSVQGCDIARACEGYITSEDTKPRFYIVLYKNCKCTIYNILYADRLKIHRSIYKNIRPNHIKRLPW